MKILIVVFISCYCLHIQNILFFYFYPRKFRSKTQRIGSVQPEKFRKNGSTFWDGPLFLVEPDGILVEWIAPVECSSITALFTKMRILKFKSQLTIAFFAAVSHLNGPLRKQNFTLTGSKGQGLWFVIGGFRSVLCVCVFQGSLLVIVIMKRQRKTQLWMYIQKSYKFRILEVTHK